MQLELKTADVQDVDNDARKNRVAPPSVSRELVGGIPAMKNTRKLHYVSGKTESMAPLW